MIKLVAGKWILLSALALALVGAVALRRGSDVPAPAASAPGVPASAVHGSDGTVAGVAPQDDLAGKGAPAPGASAKPELPIAASDSPRAPDADHGDAPSGGASSSRVASSERDPRALARPGGGGSTAESAPSHPGSNHPTAADPALADPTLADPALADPTKGDPTKGDPTSPKASRIAEESAALAEARAKLQAGDAAGTLAALAAMDREFGGGALAQERAALHVRALAESGRRDLAEREADAFLAAYPSSPLAARVRPFATKAP